MKEIIKYGLVLSAICLLASTLLATVFLFTKPKIIAQEKRELEISLKEIFLDGVSFETIEFDEDLVYKVYDAKGNLLGVVFKVKAKGYSGDIETLVGISSDEKIIGIKILNHSETPGLGSRITEKDFLNQFIKRKVNDLAITTITGATISSRAVINSVKKKAEKIKKILK